MMNLPMWSGEDDIQYVSRVPEGVLGPSQ